jgi:hypothetical protein
MIKTMQDRQPGLGTSSIVGALTLAKTGTTARTATFPDAAITVAGSAAALTSGRVPFVTTGGLLTDAAYFTTSASALGFSPTVNGGGIAVNINNSGTGNAFSSFVLAQTLGSKYLTSYFINDTYTSSGAYQAGYGVIEVQGTSTNGLNVYLRGGGIFGIYGSSSTLVASFANNGTLTVPNGTAAAPGIRLSGAAHGFYLYASTALAMSVAGALGTIFYAPNGSSQGGVVAYATPSAAEGGMNIATANDSYMQLGGWIGSLTVGGRVKAYGGAHATAPATVELLSGTAVKFAINATGIGFFATAPVAKPTVTGSRGSNAALASLLTALAGLGLLTDSSS